MQGGVLLIDKPVGPTSHDVVQAVRRKLGTRQVGHAGTLDPAASGLLVVCVNDATRLLEYMTASDKAYTGDAILGIGTDTDDATGQVVASASASAITDAQLQAAAAQLVGTINQVVPAYSAVHIDGKRAYELARQGEVVAMPSREVEIAALTLGEAVREGDVLRVPFSVRCSKGTYVRAICRDLGQLLGVPAHMASLRRIGSGPATITEAVSLETLVTSEAPTAYLKPPLTYLAEQARVEASLQQVAHLANGQRLPLADLDGTSTLQDGDVVFVCMADELALVATVVAQGGERQLQPKKVFWKRG